MEYHQLLEARGSQCPHTIGPEAQRAQVESKGKNAPGPGVGGDRVGLFYCEAQQLLSGPQGVTKEAIIGGRIMNVAASTCLVTSTTGPCIAHTRENLTES